MTFHRLRAPLLLLCLLALALHSAPADAKAGKSASMGSRGSLTTTPVAPPASGSFLQHDGSSSGTSTIKPIDRSIAPPPVRAAPAGPAVQSESLAPPPMAAPRPAVTPVGPMAGAALNPGRSFMSGLAGGLIGAGIGSMLFGGSHGGFFGEGGSGFLGAMIQLALIFFVGRWLLRRFLSRGTAPQPTAYRRMDFAEPELEPNAPTFALRATPTSVPSIAAPRPANPRQFVLTEQDLAAVEQLLQQVQTAWTAGDVAGLQRLSTPEMAGYFNEQLQQDRARGLENRVEQVRLLKGDVNETWREGPVDYATTTLHWSAVDYTLRHPGGELVEGDRQVPVESVEVWTLLRSPGAPWILSAIQQV